MMALILGGADCIYNDLDALHKLVWPHDGSLELPRAPEAEDGWCPGITIAANDAGFEFERVHHWVTLHPEKMERWQRERLVRWGERKGQPVTWCHQDGKPHLDHALPIRHGCSGSSGLFAVQVALELGCDRIVLCGVPMDARPHFNGPAWHDHWTYRATWQRWQAAEELENVRSMSGWTRELLGEPTREWLEGGVICKST
jgi:hypothetical protein